MNKVGGVSFVGLLGLIIGTATASAVFAFPGDFAAARAGSGTVLVGWLIAGTGMLGPCPAFYYLGKLKPELRDGVYNYAHADFGSYVGFSSTWGYWLSELLSNISFLTPLFASARQFLPLFGVGNSIPSAISVSVIWWIAIILILRGIKESTAVNLVSTVARIIPILVPIVIIIFTRAFSFGTFMRNFSDGEGGMSFGKQVMTITTITVRMFIGTEGAMVISGRAKRSSDVGRVTMIGFLSVLTPYIIVSFLSAGVMTNEELAAPDNPPMAGILEHVVGPWGAALMNTAVIISLLRAMLGHTIMYAECSYGAAKGGAFREAFTRINKNGAPVFAIAFTSIIAQVFLVLPYSSESTYQILYFLTTDMIMMPYFFSAMHFCKVALKQENGLIKGIGIFNTAYAIWMVFAAGIGITLATVPPYVPGILVYVEGQKEKGPRVFETKVDKAVFVALLALLVICIYFVGTGRVNPLG